MTDSTPDFPAILFVDDEATAVKYFQRAVGALAPVATASSVEEGMRLLDTHADTLAVLVSDQRMPGKYGNELLRYARDRYPHVVRILTTAYSELEHTVDAINQGQIHRYIKKPWEISALRIELKQILEFANLRKERDHLMREKLLVRQKQIVSNRIGTLNVLCSALLAPRHRELEALSRVDWRGEQGASYRPRANDSIPPVLHDEAPVTEHAWPMESYLAAALAVGIHMPEPDWFLMDYSDLVSAEAMRAGAFGHTLRNQLAQIQQRYPGYAGEQAWEVLPELLPGEVAPRADKLLLLDERNLTEFLETSCYATVSSSHASWLACLIWLNGLGQSLKITRSDMGLLAHLVPSTQVSCATRLATWIEQF